MYEYYKNNRGRQEVRKYDETDWLRTSGGVLTLSQTTNFRLTKVKEFADDNFKFDENGIKYFKRVENNVGKGEIARYEQFPISHIVSKSLVMQTCKNQGLFGKGLIFWDFHEDVKRCVDMLKFEQELNTYAENTL